MRRHTAFIAIAGLIAAGLIGAGLLLNGPAPVQWAAAQETDIQKKQHMEHARALSSAFRSVSKKLAPSVVSVRSERTIQPAVRFRNGRPEIPDEFRRFFDDDTFERFFEDIPNRPYRRRGMGSGVIIHKDGYIVTNHHVVRGADKVRVTLYDKRTFPAEVVGTDAKTDLAVLKIDAENLAAAKWGNSDKMEVGDWVLAMGSPFRLTRTVTAGIVSAKGRGNVGITDYEDFIQTDAAINPGNSGGPLVNLNGEVIGINTAIASKTGGYMGIGFAIPSNMARHIVTSIIEHGRVQRGRIGAAIQDLTQDLAKSFGYKLNGKGVLVGDVVQDGPADKAGLKSGDIVVEYNGESMDTAAHLRNAVAATKPGTKAALRVYRNGKYHTLTVTVGRIEDVTVPNQDRRNEATEATDEALGMTLNNVTEELAERLNLDKNAQGVVVTEVRPGSIAALATLRPGDLILSVGRRKVTDVDSFRKAIKSQDLSKGVRLRVQSRGLNRFVFIRKQ